MFELYIAIVHLKMIVHIFNTDFFHCSLSLSLSCTETYPI